MNHTLLRCCAALLLLALGLFWHKPAEAQNLPVACQTTGIDDLAFGTIDPLSSQTPTSANIQYRCSNPNNQSYTGVICFSVTDGVTGSRQMRDANGNTLSFKVYTDPNHTVSWGTGSNSIVLPVNIPRQSLGWSGSPVVLYGLVDAGQTTAVPGNGYVYQFTGNQTAISVAVAHPTGPTSCTGQPSRQTGQAFQATASVENNCTVSAAPLDFGAPAGVLTSAVTSTSAVTVTCAVGTAYNVGLDGGQSADVNARRMTPILGGVGSVAYQLYRDSGRSLVWGSTVGSDTVAGIGNGTAQGLPVYGKVPAQATPPAGVYQDTVKVIVTY